MVCISRARLCVKSLVIVNGPLLGEGLDNKQGPSAVVQNPAPPLILSFPIQVNADIKKYTVGEDGAPRLFKVDTRTVGRNISTKAVGSTRRHDVTNDVRLHAYAFSNASVTGTRLADLG